MLNPMIKVIERMTRAAQIHGTAFVKVRYDASADVFTFDVIQAENVTISYEQ